LDECSKEEFMKKMIKKAVGKSCQDLLALMHTP
jgi:hypothetical protein